ncbi:MAG: Re/Si-specific NAD(P)(+) transhydrogenase subunit alpha [Acidobacteriota bacterium]|jgi:NAD(P) transhydrogenase subunit alpha
MIAGVPKETFPGERRVALVPAVLPALRKMGLEVVLEAGAGDEAGFPDEAYAEVGATLTKSRDEVFQRARLLLQVRGLGANPEAGEADLARTRPEHVLIGFMEPLGAPQAARTLAGSGATAFSMELMPRISRAQSMDALSSLGTIAGYAAVLLAAGRLPKMFPMMMTAAGTITPARVFVIGAGVAGLQAIATARRLGGTVQAYDVRPAVREQVESLGGRFVELPLEAGDSEDAGGYARAQGEDFYRKQRELMARVVAESDVVITTAAIPGKPSPVLITGDMVAGMAPLSVIVDLAAERGGNCELTRADEVVVEHGVTILGPTNLPSTVPYHASQMYAKNLTTFLGLLVKEGELNLDQDDEILKDTLLVRGGEVVNPRVQELLGAVAAGA